MKGVWLKWCLKRCFKFFEFIVFVSLCCQRNLKIFRTRLKDSLFTCQSMLMLLLHPHIQTPWAIFIQANIYFAQVISKMENRIRWMTPNTFLAAAYYLYRVAGLQFTICVLAAIKQSCSS